jgi:hypothetical protein
MLRINLTGPKSAEPLLGSACLESNSDPVGLALYSTRGTKIAGYYIQARPWTHVKIEAHLETMSYCVWENGETAVTDARFASPIQDIGEIRIITGGETNTAGNNQHMADITCTYNPRPGAVDIHLTSNIDEIEFVEGAASTIQAVIYFYELSVYFYYFTQDLDDTDDMISHPPDFI